MLVMDIRRLDPQDDSAHRWYAALYAGAAADRTAPIVVAESSLLTALRTNADNPNFDRHGYGAWEGTTCLGAATLDLPRRENLHLAEIDVNVPPAHRRHGVGAALLDHTLQLAKKQGRTTITGEVNVPQAQAFADSAPGGFLLPRGFASQHTEERLLLDVPVPDETLTALEPPADGFRAVSWLGVPPDQWLATFAEMNTLMERDVPIGDLDREPTVYDAERIASSQQRLTDQGYGIVTTLIVDSDDQPAAYTTMLVTANGVDVMQDDTFVLRARRGNRLGAKAKAANLRQLAQHHPDARHVHTWTAETNDAMRSINERCGFRAVETMHEVELAL